MARTISDENIKLNIIIDGNQAQKELLDVEKATRKYEKANKDLRLERKKVEKELGKSSKEYKTLSAEIKSNNNIIAANKTKMQQLQKQIGITGLTMSQLKKRASLLRMQLMHTIPGGEKEKAYRKELFAIQTRLSKLSLKAKTAKFSISGIANGFNKYAALGASAIAATTGLVLGLQKMIDYNGKLSDSQADVMKTTGMTKAEVDELTKSFGILNTRTSRMDLLKIAEEGGRIGIAKNEISDFVAVMNKANVALGDSFEGGPEEVASKLGKLKLLFKETKDIGVDKAYESIGSAINELGANGVATETNIAAFATRVGSLPDKLKPTIQDALGLGAAFEESGVQAEISGRAYSIFLGQAAKESEKFAKVMGISTEEVENLINTNPTEFFIQFSDKLATTQKTGTDTAKTMAKLGLSADGVKKIVGAAGNNVGRFRELLQLSNKSMVEGTSLTKEYNIKNNNLAATLEKVKKKMLGAFSSEAIVGGLSSLVTWFGKLIGAVKDVNKEFDLQTETTFKSSENNRRLAKESDVLLKRYQTLTKEGLIPTKEQKKELDTITLQLKDRLGETVIAIDKETGSYKLNTEAVKEQIKLKRLTADEEAMTLVSRKKGAEDRKKELEITVRDAKKEFDLRRNNFEETNATALKAYRTAKGLSAQEKLQLIERLDGYKEQEKARKVAILATGKLNTQIERELDLKNKLNDLNFTQKDVDNYFKDNTPKEGTEKFIGNTKFVFKGGKWVAEKPTVKKGNPNNENAALLAAAKKKSEKEITDFIKTQQNKRVNNQKTVLEQQLFEIDENYRLQIKKAGENHELVKQLEAERDLDKENLRNQRNIEAKIKADEIIKQMEEEKAITDEQKEILRLERESLKHISALEKLALNEEEKANLVALIQEKTEIKLQNIRSKYDRKELLDRKKLHQQILNESISYVGQQTRLGQALLAIKGVMAAKETLIELGLLKNKIAIGTSSAIAATAEGKAQTAKVGFPWNIPLLIGFAAQVSGIVSAIQGAANPPNVSVKGFEEGFYPVQRQQDGKLFNAQFGGETTSGMVSKPTVFMAGENGPELIIDSKAYQQMSPDIKGSMHREIARIKGFEEGFYQAPQQRTEVPLSDTNVSLNETDVLNQEIVSILSRATNVLEKLEAEGIEAYISNDLKNGKRIKKLTDNYEKFVQKSKV